MLRYPAAERVRRPWREGDEIEGWTFLDSLWMVAITVSTIGYGEIPYEFTDAQRFWTMIAMYTTVIAWLYAIGALFTLFQDAGFRQVLRYTLFTRQVRAINERFYLVCGLGDAGDNTYVLALAANALAAWDAEHSDARCAGRHG